MYPKRCLPYVFWYKPFPNLTERWRNFPPIDLVERKRSSLSRALQVSLLFGFFERCFVVLINVCASDWQKIISSDKFSSIVFYWWKIVFVVNFQIRDSSENLYICLTCDFYTRVSNVSLVNWLLFSLVSLSRTALGAPTDWKLSFFFQKRGKGNELKTHTHFAAWS